MQSLDSDHLDRRIGPIAYVGGPFDPTSKGWPLKAGESYMAFSNAGIKRSWGKRLPLHSWTVCQGDTKHGNIELLM